MTATLDRPAALDRTPPNDQGAEQAVLGGMMLSKDAIADVVEILRTGDFYRPAHSTIFDVILRLYGDNEPADPVTVAAALAAADPTRFERIGGAAYLHDCLVAVPTAANTTFYARIVAERAQQRRLIEVGTRIVQLGFGADGAGRDMGSTVDLAQQLTYELTERRSGDGLAALADLLQPTVDEIESLGQNTGTLRGIPTGFADLDRLMNGLMPGQLIVVAGRPGQGKSTMAVGVAANAAINHGLASAVFSLEMSGVEIVMRLLSAHARVPLNVLRSGALTDDDWAKIARRLGSLGDNVPLFIDETPNMTLMEIRGKARRLKQRNDLRLIVVDYIQLMEGQRRSENRQQEIAELSRGLKLLSKEMAVPVIAVAQLN